MTTKVHILLYHHFPYFATSLFPSLTCCFFLQNLSYYQKQILSNKVCHEKNFNFYAATLALSVSIFVADIFAVPPLSCYT